MDWQQKAAAIQALAGWQNFALKMRGPENWYVQHSGLEQKEGGLLSDGPQHGKTPEDAVNQCWDWMTDPEYYLVWSTYRDSRRAVRWDGFMWENVNEEL